MDLDAIYDRIQSNLSTRLDTTSQKLRNQLIIALFSSNTPWLLDSAMSRRLGQTVEMFGRLRRRSFCEVLRKRLGGLPIESNNGCTSEQLEAQLAQRITTWAYCRNGEDRGVVELSYVGDATADLRRISDFMTPALVDRAVQQAASRACRDELKLSDDLLAECIEEQVRWIADRLRPSNAAEHLD